MKQDYLDQILLEAARKDPEYQKLLKECRQVEEHYHRILQALPPEDQEKLEHYISLCEELEHRLSLLALEIPRE